MKIFRFAKNHCNLWTKNAWKYRSLWANIDAMASSWKLTVLTKKNNLFRWPWITIGRKESSFLAETLIDTCDTVDSSEILHHLTCHETLQIKNIYSINWCRISEPSTVWHCLVLTHKPPLQRHFQPSQKSSMKSAANAKSEQTKPNQRLGDLTSSMPSNAAKSLVSFFYSNANRSWKRSVKIANSWDIVAISKPHPCFFKG